MINSVYSYGASTLVVGAADAAAVAVADAFAAVANVVCDVE